MNQQGLDRETIQTDVLVLGGGIAGFRAAIAARETGAEVVLAHKGHGASPYVIGFNSPIGSADERDGPDVFAEDMVRGGYGLNERPLVRILAEESIDAFRELSVLGVPFAQSGGRIAQRHLSGNTYPRSLYIAEGTGSALMKALKKRARELGVSIFGGLRAIDLLRDNDAVAGALLWKPHTATLTSIRAGATVLAMGGIGRLFADSTYPADVAADALGFALDAGAALIDMEFVQFEPVVTIWPEQCRGMEMPTAMLGDGAQLRNAIGERFMLRVNPPHGEKHIEKAKMALHIQREIDEGRGLFPGGVIFDTTTVPREKLESYISHCSRLRGAGLEPTTRSPIVAPGAHSVMGGVAIDERGSTGVPGLYAGGESAAGVHGASRIAGNGCSDTLVFGALAGRSAARCIRPSYCGRWSGMEGAVEQKLLSSGQFPIDEARRLKDEIRDTVAKAAGIWRSAVSLEEGLVGIGKIRQELLDARSDSLPSAVELMEARRMTDVAATVIGSALLRTESRGAHQRTDFPATDELNWLVHNEYRKEADGRLASRTIEVTKE
ncbi:FAD-binding protein [Variovorax sp. N23]|uniref:FAD-binding protein n=1 Tax=Variovorax sp. N23 TaxID=2980555 RepID=UPI0021CA4FA5|nr:FAD-binding protein [Variovorax sp. N23]MCU4119041.1 FAD-binding protein [Variovorax sp. N23]